MSTTASFYPLQPHQYQLLRSAVSAVSSLKLPVGLPPSDFVVLFDGTNNSNYKLSAQDLPNPAQEQRFTSVGRLEQIGDYIGGVGGAQREGAEVDGSAATGEGCKARVLAILDDIREFAKLFAGDIACIDVCGFSRGAAEARDFLNELDKLHVNNANGHELKFRSSAMLLDTVETGQQDVLALGIPDSCEFVLHLVSADETRSELFPLSSILPVGGYEGDPRLNEIYLPGVHADIGGSWQSFAGLIAELLTREYFVKRGILPDVTLADSTLKQVASLDATWWTNSGPFLGPDLPAVISPIERKVYTYMDGLPYGGTGDTPPGSPPQYQWIDGAWRNTYWLNEPLSEARLAELQQQYPGWTQPWFTGTDSPTLIEAPASGGVLADSDGNSILRGSAQTDWLFGDRTSTLEGNEGIDYLYGGGGTRLLGGAGNDVYVAVGGDVIDDSDRSGVLHVPGTKGQPVFTRDGYDLIIAWRNGASPPIRVNNWLTAGGQASVPAFRIVADGGLRAGAKCLQFDAAQITAQLLVSTGTSAADSLTAVDGYANTLCGLAGDDTLRGGSGDDTFLLNSGDGLDIILDQTGHNVVAFGQDVSSQSVDALHIGNDLVLKYGRTDVATVKDWFSTGSSLHSI